MSEGLDWAIPAAAAAAAPAGVIVALLARRGLGRGRAGLAWGAAVVRGAAVAAALLGAAGPHVTSRDASRGVVFVAASDHADVPGRADRILRFPSEAPDAAAALGLLRASAPADRPADLVLAWARSDAPPALGSTIDALTPRGAMVSILRPAPGAEADRATPAPRLVVPSAVAEGVPFTVTIDAGDRPFAAAAAVFAVDGHETPLVLPVGARRAESPPAEVRAGSHVLTLRTADRPPVAAIIRVTAPPTVLLVAQSGIEPPLARRLRAQGLTVTVASDIAADLAPPADVIVLGPGTGVSCAADVASRVAAGAGLLVAGGEGRAGLSRLLGTALEELLPVRLPDAPPAPSPPPERPPETPPPSPEAPKPVIDEAERKALRVALLLCIDRSGSMAGVKLRMAQEAAIAAARTLTPEDRVGVVAFDEEADWVAPFQAASDMAALYRRIQALRADGGTNLHPALRDGISAITAQECGIRHIILLTDGATRDAVFSDLVEGAAAQGVTLSTVAVGEGADKDLLGRLAQWGRGRYYPAVDPARLPQVLTLDTQRFVAAPRDAARERAAAPDVVPPAPETPPAATNEPPDPAPADERAPPVPEAPPRTPRVAGTSPFLAGLESEPWPRLRHAENVAVRGYASAPLVWDDGTGPALVLGRGGAGRCAVIAADVVTPAAREWWDWPDSGRVLAQLVRFLAPAQPPSDGAPSVRFLATGDASAVAVVNVPGGGVLRLRPFGGGEEIRVTCRADGDVSVGELPGRPAGDLWSGDFTGGPEGAVQSVACGGLAPSHRDDAAFAEFLAERSGARLADRLPEARDGPPVERREDRSAPFLIGAAVLLVAEAALRRGVRG